MGDQEGTDEELLKASIDDAAHFCLFYDRFGRRVLAFHLNRTLNPEVAADLTSETFAVAFESRSRFRGAHDGSAARWLFVIAKRLLARYFRRLEVDRRAMARLGMERPDLDQDDLREIETMIDLNATKRVLQSALSVLSSAEREAVVLRVLEEREYAEVASMMRSSEQVARKRVSRGLRALARVISKGREEAEYGW